ncbi:hypothetical protein CIB84_008521, partial [Bambusicola thoracicus]
MVSPGDRAQAYCELEHVLGEDDSRPPCGVVNRLLAEVSQDLTAAQGVPDSVRMAASNVLVALARTHFTLVMAELQGHLKAAREMSKEFVLVALSKLFTSYAPQCTSFVWLTLAGLRSVVGQVRSGQTLRIACAVVKQWSEGVKFHLSCGKQCPWPAMEKEQIYENLHQLFCSVVRNWQDCKEEKDKEAILGAVAAMMAVLLQEELHREDVWEQLLWLAHLCQEVQDTFRVAKSLSIFLEALDRVQCVIPKDKFLALTTAVFYQLSDDTKEHSEADRAELTHCILLQGPKGCPNEQVASICLLTRKITPAIDPWQVRRAILQFIKDMLSANARSCSAWDVVGHFFSEFSRTTGRRLLWPRLLHYVVPAQYTGMLISVSRCIQALAEREDLTERETEELDPHFLSSVFQGPMLTPQTLLARLLVVAGSPFAGSELQAAALLLMQNLHGRIHGAVGAIWAAEIPLLLQYLEGKDESVPDSAEWEHHLLKFLRASLETVEDEAWTEALSCELSRWLSSSPSSCGEKSFLYKALGTVLGACKGVVLAQEKLLQHLEEANAEEPSEAQGMISLLSHAAESNFHTVLDTLTTFASRLCKGQNVKISGCKKMELNSRRAQATRSALILAHGSLALRASKEQLLARLEGDMVGNILLLYSCSCRDLQNTLALLQSITDFSSAFQAVGDSACFNPSLKSKLLEILMDLLRKYRLGIPVSPVPLKMVLALEQLSKLKLSLEYKGKCEMLVLCFKNIVMHPSAGMMLKIRKSQQAAQYLQLLQTSLKALARLVVILLETGPNRGLFRIIVRRGDVCKYFGFLVGLLAPLTCDPMPTSRQLAVTCLSSLLRIQAKVTNTAIETGDIGSLCERLNDCSTICQLQTSSKIARELLILYILRSCTFFPQQSAFMPFVFQAVVILAHYHTVDTIENFSRLPKFSD